MKQKTSRTVSENSRNFTFPSEFRRRMEIINEEEYSEEKRINQEVKKHKIKGETESRRKRKGFQFPKLLCKISPAYKNFARRKLSEKIPNFLGKR